jgi:hypothetical protein
MGYEPQVLGLARKEFRDEHRGVFFFFSSAGV